MKNKKGFTLVELLVAITILGIVTLVSLPMIRVIQGSMQLSKEKVYKESILSAAKNYNDLHEMDTFGYQNSGCVDIYYTDLVDSKLLDELDLSDSKVIPDKIFVRVIKRNDNYEYEVFMPTADTISSIDFTVCEGSLTESGPKIKFTPEKDLVPKKNNSTVVKIHDDFGISPNAVIKYQWAYASNPTNLIGTAQTKEFRNGVVNDLTLTVNAPTGLNGRFVLVVTPITLQNQIGLSTTTKAISQEFVLDNTAPTIVVKLFKESGGGKTGSALSTKSNANSSITTWAKHGYYIDVSESSDTNGIKKQVWEWNAAGNVSLDKTLSESRKQTNTSKTNKTLTARGARYGKITMCDEANNCRTVEITVNLSPIYYIKYTGGSSGSVANTTCYYEHNCTLANNGFGKTGYYFTKWKIGSTNYNAGATVKNLSSADGTTLTATAQWAGNTYTINFNGNGSTSGSVSSLSCTYGSNCVLRSNGFTRNGYHFTGWKIGSKVYGNGATVSNLATGGTLTAYAQWAGNTYKIKYSGNGATGGSTAETTCTYGSNCSLRGNGFSRTGYNFSSWKIGNNYYSGGQTISNLSTGADVTATAQWSIKKYTISYNCNGGWNCPGSQTKTHGTNINLGGTPTRDGWSFQGWSTSSTATSGYGAGASYSGNGNVTFYATWKRTITVYFNAGKCGWMGNTSRSCSYYNNQTSCNITAPSFSTVGGTTKDGTPYSNWLKARGWNTSSGAASSSYNMGASKAFSSNQTYYAIVTFDGWVTNRKWFVYSDTGLIVRQQPNWDKSGVMHKDTYCRNYGSTDWVYRNVADNPIWARLTQYRNPPYIDKCGSGNASGWDDNCDGWASMRFIRPA